MDDLLARMNAAASQAIAEAQKPAAEPAAEAAPAEEPVAESAPADGATDAGDPPVEDGGADAAEAAEAAPEAPVEAAPEKDLADEIIAVRQAADRRVRTAEKRVAALEAELKAARESAPNADALKKQVVEDIFNKMRRSPARFFEENGQKFQDFIDAAIREGESRHSPMGAEFDELREEMRQLRAEREEMKRQAEVQARNANDARVKNQFLSMVTKSEYPTLFGMFQGAEDRLFNEALQVAEAHQKTHGEAPSAPAVIKYLEGMYAERVKKLSGVSPTSPAPEQKKPAAPKTITTKAVSESRGTGKPFGQLGRDEQRDALLKAVTQATSRTAN